MIAYKLEREIVYNLFGQKGAEFEGIDYVFSFSFSSNKLRQMTHGNKWFRYAAIEKWVSKTKTESQISSTFPKNFWCKLSVKWIQKW